MTVSKSYTFTHAICRRPADSAVAGLRAVDTGAPDLALFRQHHEDYIAALRSTGAKVTVRPDDTYLGYMQELAGLPYIFGSAAQGREPHQAERHIGVDCADLMVYGLRRLGHDVGYRSSRTLGPISRRVVSGVAARRGDVYLAGGRPVRVGAGGVAPGDWLIFEGHVGAFVEDRGRPGVLDTRDLVIILYKT